MLEDCGYMARAAYLMDKLMVRVGLSGKSFIPLLSSFACAIPGVMATRVIENRRDRLTTILVAPLMSCSARLPVYTLLIGAFIPARQFAGRPAAVAGPDAVRHVPAGHRGGRGRGAGAEADAVARPDAAVRDGAAELQVAVAARSCCARMVERGWSFVHRAGTLILAVSIVVWAASYYPHNPAVVSETLAPRSQALTARTDRQRPTSSTERAESKSQLIRRRARQSPPRTSATATWAGWATRSSRPCGRWAGIGGSAAR